MIGKELIEKKQIPLAHVREILKERDGDAEPSYEQTQTMEYVNKFAKVSKSDAEGLLNNLLNIQNMEEEVAVKLVDFLPEDVEGVKLLLSKNSKLDDSQIREAFDLVKKTVSKS
jgi:DNA-directed RNA polymerase subunit F